MACKQWNDEWVARIYDELAPAAAAECDAHLASCAGCRDTMGGLRESRALLEECAPSVPAAPPLVVLRPRATWAPVWGFAVGIACAAIAFAVGYAISPIAVQDADPAGGPTPALVATRDGSDDATIGQLRNRLATFERRIAELERRGTEELARIERQREDDLGYFMRSMTEAELRTDTRFDYAQEALNLLALRQDPRIRER